MNSKQKFAFLVGVIAIAMMGLYPPWKEAGAKGLPMAYAPIFAPPQPLNPANGLEVDVVRLLLQVGVAAILTGGLVAASAPPPPAGGTQAPGGFPRPQIDIQPPPAQPKWQTNFEPARLDEEDDEDEEEDEDDDDDDNVVELTDSKHVIRLPAGKTYGEFLIESDEDPEYWESLAEARGVVKLPPGKRVQLEVKNDKDVDLSFVALMDPSTLHSVDLSESAVKDWELAHLQRLTDLRELDLSATKVSNQALSYIKSLDKLEKLWLDGTQVDDSCLEDLKKFENLKKLSIKETKITADGVKQLQEKLTDCSVET